jgi:hypothetical protein
MLPFRSPLAAAFVAVATTLPATAATLDQTFETTWEGRPGFESLVLRVDAFDPSLGTLRSARVDWSVAYEFTAVLEYEGAPGSTGAGGATAAIEIQLGLVEELEPLSRRTDTVFLGCQAPADSGRCLGIVRQPGSASGSFVTGQFYDALASLDPVELMPETFLGGPGVFVPLDFSSWTDAGDPTIIDATLRFQEARFAVTYTYEPAPPAVPVPMPAVLLLGALGCLAAVRRRRLGR